MKIIFFASGDFAIGCLEALIKNNYGLSALVTQTAKKKGRHLNFGSPQIASIAQKSNIPVLQPQNLSDKNFVQTLENQNPDLFVVIAYGNIIPKRILDIPKIFSINVHASLLPRYRGAAPVSWAIINGDKETGISIIKMNEFIDEGEIILQQNLDIMSIDDAVSLNKRLSQLAAQMLITAIKLIETNNFKLMPQAGSVSLAPKLKKQDGRIIWSRSSRDIYNQIRGLIPWPGSSTYFHNKLLKILAAEETERIKEGSPGEVLEVSKERLIVACGKSALSLKELQMEGAKALQVKEFLSGHKISVGEFLT